MPLTAGTVDTTPTRKTLSFSYIDTNGQVRTDSYDIPIATLDATVNALMAEIEDLTNANLWDVAITNYFAVTTGSKAAATNAVDDSVYDNIVILMKTPANLSVDFFLPAPVAADTLIDGTINPNVPALAGLVAALVTLFGGSYAAKSYRYSERRKKNRATKA